MKGSYSLSRSVGEAHPAVCGFSRWALCTKHRWEGHASPWAKKHWPLGGRGQGQEPQRWQQSGLKCEEHQDEAAESRCRAQRAPAAPSARRREQKRQEKTEGEAWAPARAAQPGVLGSREQDGRGLSEGLWQHKRCPSHGFCAPWLGFGMHEVFSRTSVHCPYGRGSLKPTSRPACPWCFGAFRAAQSCTCMPQMQVEWAWDRGKQCPPNKGVRPDSRPLGHSWGSDFPEGTAEE